MIDWCVLVMRDLQAVYSYSCFSITDTVCTCKALLPLTHRTAESGLSCLSYSDRKEGKDESMWHLSQTGKAITKQRWSWSNLLLLFNGDNKPQTDIHDAPLSFAVLQRFTHVRDRPAV